MGRLAQPQPYTVLYPNPAELLACQAVHWRENPCMVALQFPEGREKFYHKLFLHKGEYVYLAGSRIKNSDGVPEFQILICYIRPEKGIATYKRRWEIETAFRAMKSSGFNIEDTHLRDTERIARLLAMVCIALVWAYLVGEHKDINVKPIRILKHGRKAKSLVKYGLEEISNALFSNG